MFEPTPPLLAGPSFCRSSAHFVTFLAWEAQNFRRSSGRSVSRRSVRLRLHVVSGLSMSHVVEWSWRRQVDHRRSVAASLWWLRLDRRSTGAWYGGRPVWLGGVLTDVAVDRLVSWIEAGGPGRAAMPDALADHLIAPRRRRHRKLLLRTPAGQRGGEKWLMSAWRRVRQDGVVDYDLARLGTREFEHLVQVLAIGIQGPGAQVFGDGRDGGREITFEGA
ncbi:hypothetical protein [Actinosynnema sp. NPDC023587]|uniref:hypothetical protein n=1 Tax=Actinosynnema sp. NPDC023587 TaxID=3154695 RepID=UPI0033F0F6E2